MSAFKIVQKVASVTTATGVAATSSPISLQSGYLRILPEADAYIEVGTNPGINTSTSLWVPGGQAVVIKEYVASQRVVGVTTGTTTIIDFPEGQSTPVGEGDYIALTGIQPTGINTTYAQVASVNSSSNVGGYYSTRITLNWNTASIAGVVTVTNSAEVRRAVKVAIKDDASGGITHITEIQIASAV